MSSIPDPKDEAREPERSPTKSSGSLRIATVAGIPIRIHFTFLFLVAYVLAIGKGNLMALLLVLLVFACVILHELGHALTASRYGIKTRDITMYPIGGLALLQGRPKPAEEVWIALAGPAVNVVIAIILGAVLYFTKGGIPLPTSGEIEALSLMPLLFYSNVLLAVFNMIPAFPMDGGRVLRSLLALAMPEARATQIAAAVGQVMAVGFGIVGVLTTNLLLIVIAFFVYIGAGQEAAFTVTRSFLEGHKLSDAMLVNFASLNHGDSMERAAEMLLAGSQHDFPVMSGEELVGVLTRTEIAQGLAKEGGGGYVAAYMRREFKTASPYMPLEKAMDLFTRDDPTPILVMEEGRLLGMLTTDNLSEFIMLQHAKSQAQGV